MNKEMLDIVNDLSRKPTTESALQIMELSGENLILKQQCKKQKEVIKKIMYKIENYTTLNEPRIRKELLDILKEAKENENNK